MKTTPAQPPAPPRPDARDTAARKATAARPTSSHRRLAFVVFFVGVALASAAFFWCAGREVAAIRDDVATRGASLAAAVQREVASRSQLLDAIASYVAASGGDNRAELRSFLSELTRRQAGTALLDWVPRIGADTLKAYEEKQWLQGQPEFRVHRGSGPLPPEPEYLPLHFGVGAGAQVSGLDLSAGSDLSAVPDLASAIATSKTRHGPAAASPLALVRPEGTRPAAVFVSPVFGGRPATAADRQDEPVGYAFGLFDVEAIARSAISEGDRSAVSIELRDAGGSEPLFVQKAAHSEAESQDVVVTLWNAIGLKAVPASVGFDVAGRRWAVVVGAGERVVAMHVTWIPWAVAATFLLLSVAMAAVADGYATQGAGLATLRRRLAGERREAMDKLSRINDELEREKLDRRRTEESLFREKQQFRLMFNAVPAMIFYKDTKNRFLLVNEAAAASMGRSVEEMEGRPCADIVPARAYELYRDDLEIIQSGEPRLGIIEETVSAGGKTVWTRTDKLPEYDAMGRVVGILVFSQDITEHRHAEAEVRRLNEELEQRVSVRTAELRAANQELESFAYSVSHDLRTPLRTIDGFSKLILEEHGEALPAGAHEYLKRLRGAAQRMGHLIDDLLKLTRVSRAELRREEVDLSAIARHVLDDLRRDNPGRRVDVVVEATPFASCDPVLLSNVLQNLIGNAWKFTARSAEPRIEFGSRTVDGDRTAYYVRDNGVGFDMVYADRLFGAFQRLHSHDEFEGSGIGLATVQLILRRHGGEVWAESVPDQGSTFYFTVGS